MRLVIKNSIQLCQAFKVSIVLRHSNYNNRIISIEGTFLGHPVDQNFVYSCNHPLPLELREKQSITVFKQTRKGPDTPDAIRQRDAIF